jgi:LAGLIDADG DNA endonuclease family protein
MGSDAGPWFSSREFLSAYISGYVDGEGCFTVSISPRAKLLVGWEVRPSFSVSQNGDRAEVLHVIQAYFGCGSIRPDRSDKTLKWETRRLDDLVERIVPHFERYPLLSGKRLDFESFASVCRLAAVGAHRTRAGLIEIVELARMMNPSGKRRYDAEAILASLRQGEGIVCASGNGGITRSSDLHEWRNDLGAVSSRDPVKL